MITVTSTASKKIQANLNKRGKGIGIRVGVRTKGCSGLAYVLEYVDKYMEDANTINYAPVSYTHLTLPTNREV